MKKVKENGQTVFGRDALLEKLKTLPKTPGVYFHKAIDGEIIYVGKAAVLRNRVRQYFQSKNDMDIKTRALVAEIYDTDWVETDSEIDALFLESEMVKRYMPRFNILLRDDKSQLYVRINMKDEWPYVGFTRAPLDDGADYFGPYYSGTGMKQALRYLRRVFPYYTREVKPGKRDLDAHLGLSPHHSMSSADYKASLRTLIRYIRGGKKQITEEIERDMRRAAKEQDFEEAARQRNRLSSLRDLQTRIMFGDKEFMDLSKDFALADLTELLGLERTPQRIEGYDISHMSGTNVVASMVVFRNGASDRGEYRKFKTKKEHNNDFYNMNETLSRRLAEKNIKAWGTPDLMLIDGGKGQLDAALRARDTVQKANDDAGIVCRVGHIPFIGLAKQQEQIVVDKARSNVTINQEMLHKLRGYLTESADFVLINLPHTTHIIKLLQRIRDESHRFAVSYHTVLKRANATKSTLEDIPGIGPATRRKLIRTFGSLKAVMEADETEVAAVVGASKARLVAQEKMGNSKTNDPMTNDSNGATVKDNDQ